MQFSVLIPCYNEGHHVGKALDDLIAKLSTSAYEYEIIVVDDASTDDSRDEIGKRPVTLISHRFNKGYGASLKTAAAQAKYDWLLFYDADGEHTPETLDSLFAAAPGADMVVGARTGRKGPFIRQPGKWLLTRVARYLTDFDIPDLNSGLRLVQRSIFNEFLPLYPDGFSLTTTITIAALKNHCVVRYVPIQTHKRDGGKSTVGWRDALMMITLISRLITMFSPLKLFLSIAGVLFTLGFLSLVNDVIHLDLNESTYFLITTSLIIFSFGLLADQIAEIRRRL